MNIALIGNGAIAGHLRGVLAAEGMQLKAVLLRPERALSAPELPVITNPADLPRDTQVVVDCAGHSALQAYGAAILGAGHDLLTVSLGALADADLHQRLTHSAQRGDARLHLASGAIGALDCLRAAATGQLHEVRYTGRKPPQGWRGSRAEDLLDLDAMAGPAQTHFTGSARAAALAYPKNANVAAAVALAGLGFDATEVALIADPAAPGNVHEIAASGDFGSFTFRLEGRTLPDNPRTSALAAMSVLSALRDRRARLHF